jgi:transposase
MVALLLYSYARGERSSRRIERRCLEDVATRVICVNQTPDHTTIARFRQRGDPRPGGVVVGLDLHGHDRIFLKVEEPAGWIAAAVRGHH